MEPVTLTVICASRSLPDSVYDFPVAPLIAFLSRSHWYANDAPDSQVPGLAVSFLPTWAVPVIFGVAAVTGVVAGGDSTEALAPTCRNPVMSVIR